MYIPFFKIPKNSKVILYGFGYEGKRCYDQIIKSNYCKLVAVVDRKYQGTVVSGLRIISQSEICEQEFNYIFISIVDKNIVNGIICELLERNIERNKIITYGHDYLESPAEDMVVTWQTDFPAYINKAYEMMKGFAKRPAEYFYGLAFFLAHSNKEESLRCLKERLRQVDCCQQKIILYQMMYQLEIFDADCMREFMDELKHLNQQDRDTLYGLVIDSTLMPFPYPEYMYDEFFLDRIELQKRICQYYGLYNNDIEKGKKYNRNNNKRIAIVTERFRPKCITDAPSQIVQVLAKVFVDLGYNVKIFVLFSYADLNIEHTFLYGLNTAFHSAMLDFDMDYLKQNNIQICCEFIEDINERLRKNIFNIKEYNPAFILDAADEMFPEAYALIDEFKIITKPMRDMSYSSAFDRYLVRNKKHEIWEQDTYHAVPAEALYEANFGNIVYTTSHIYSRKEFDLAEDDYLIITVGIRLKYDVSEEMIWEVSEYLARQDHVKWILVGDRPRTDYGLYKALLQQKKIIEWGEEKDLFALYKLCNVCLNPIRHGGGLSIRIALAAGLPVVVSDQIINDFMMLIEPRCVVHGSYKEMMDFIDKIRKNENLYEELSSGIERKIKGYTISGDARKVLDCYRSI